MNIHVLFCILLFAKWRMTLWFFSLIFTKDTFWICSNCTVCFGEKVRVFIFILSTWITEEIMESIEQTLVRRGGAVSQWSRSNTCSIHIYISLNVMSSSKQLSPSNLQMTSQPSSIPQHSLGNCQYFIFYNRGVFIFILSTSNSKNNGIEQFLVCRG